jgi:hypothetical protein
MKQFKLKYIATLIIFYFLALNLSAQDVRISSSLEKDSIWLGDQIKLMLMAEYPAGIKIQFPVGKDSLQNGVEVLSRSAVDTSKLDVGRLQLRQTYIITCFDSGPRQIEPFVFTLQSATKTDSIKTNDLSLFVMFPGVDLKKGPADIKKPFSAPITLKEIAPWLLGAILIGAIIFLIIYAISRRRKNMPLFQAPPKPKLPPHVIALSELDKLKEEQLWQHDKVKEYYTRVTDILRVYIEERFEVPAMEQTTIEILDSFKGKKTDLDATSFDKLRKILEMADLVKFAKYFPLPDDNHFTMVSSYYFVEQTKIEVTEPQKKTEVIKEGEENKP